MAFQKNKSIEDALKVLMEIAGEGKSCGNRELARRLKMNTTRVNRFLKTLHDAGFLEQDENLRYHSGSGMEVLSAQCLHGSRLLRASLPVISKLLPSDYIIGIGALHRDIVSYLFHAAPQMALAEGLGKLRSFPATYSSIGLMLTALKPVEFIEELYKDKEPIPGNIKTYNELVDNLKRFKDQNYAVVPSYGEPGFHTMAVPVGKNAIGAIAFAKIRKDEIKYMLELLNEQASLINQIIDDGLDFEADFKFEFAV